MFKKGTKPYSVFKNKCPRCQEGEFFKNKMSYLLNKQIALHKNCPKCNFKYMIEPSFFYGAMYVNYTLSVALCVAIFVISKVIIGLEIVPSFISIVVVSLLVTPILLRLSRSIYINMFIDYDEKVNAEVNKVKTGEIE